MQEHWIHTAYYCVLSWGMIAFVYLVIQHNPLLRWDLYVWIPCWKWWKMWDLTVSILFHSSSHRQNILSSEWKPPCFCRKEWAILCPINDPVSVIFLTISPPLTGLGRLHCEPELKDGCLQKIPQFLTSERRICLCKQMVLVEKAGFCVKYAGLL